MLLIFFLFILTVTFHPNIIHAGEKTQKVCLPIEAEDLRKGYEDTTFLFDNMFIFDIRLYKKTIKGGMIPLVKLISEDMFKLKYIYNVKLWREKDVYLVGSDTESAKSFCQKMIEKDYGVDDIYYLVDGMKAWKGPRTVPFNTVKCDSFGPEELKRIEESGKKIYYIDWRFPEFFYNEGHIPGAVNGYGREGRFGGIEDMLRGYFKFRPIYIDLMRGDALAVFISYDEGTSEHRCRIEKWATQIQNMYYLSGGMMEWKGAINVRD